VSAGAAFAAIVAISIITYISRAGLILFLADRHLPAEAVRALRYVGPAVLSSLTVNLLAGGKGISGVTGPEVAAVGVGAVVAALTKNLIASLFAGMATIWIIILVT
jgi:branched-subunit amino acid transport protein